MGFDKNFLFGVATSAAQIEGGAVGKTVATISLL